jgi:hypothetical protein
LNNKQQPYENQSNSSIVEGQTQTT